MSNGNGYTNKELLNIIIETQDKRKNRFTSRKSKYKNFKTRTKRLACSRVCIGGVSQRPNVGGIMECCGHGCCNGG